MKNKSHKRRVRTRDARVTDKNYSLRMDCMAHNIERTEASEDSIMVTNVALGLLVIGSPFALILSVLEVLS